SGTPASTRRSTWRPSRRPGSCRAATSAARTRPLQRRRSPCSREIEARLMDRFAHYGWPFLEPRHAALAKEMEAFASESLGFTHGEDADAICRRLVQDLVCAGYLRHAVTD